MEMIIIKTIGAIKFIDNVVVDIERGQTEQGYVYKNYDNYETGKGICYIPELTDDMFTKQDFVDNFGEHADIVFQMIDWQSPFSYYDELMADIKNEELRNTQ